ncbi:peptidase inhibitor family I36 protein [Streptomyces sp. NPDC005917]|uniref:peptidase inhibitor family I36 protein n=1 Tax=unclassified Streptomyces TaxID=2593676 RepID=UPI0033F3F62B
MKLRTWSLAAALALTALVAPAQSASAHASAAPSCPDGSVCFWSGEGFGGNYWD